eukprot:3077275-Prymnesium_polylepis.1
MERRVAQEGDSPATQRIEERTDANLLAVAGAQPEPRERALLHVCRAALDLPCLRRAHVGAVARDERGAAHVLNRREEAGVRRRALEGRRRRADLRHFPPSRGEVTCTI